MSFLFFNKENIIRRALAALVLFLMAIDLALAIELNTEIIRLRKREALFFMILNVSLRLSEKPTEIKRERRVAREAFETNGCYLTKTQAHEVSSITASDNRASRL